MYIVYIEKKEKRKLENKGKKEKKREMIKRKDIQINGMGKVLEMI